MIVVARDVCSAPGCLELNTFVDSGSLARRRDPAWLLVFEVAQPFLAAAAWLPGGTTARLLTVFEENLNW